MIIGNGSVVTLDDLKDERVVHVCDGDGFNRFVLVDRTGSVNTGILAKMLDALRQFNGRMCYTPENGDAILDEVRKALPAGIDATQAFYDDGRCMLFVFDSDDGVKTAPRDRDFIEPVVRRLVDKLSVPFFQDKADLSVEGFETDKYGTFTVKLTGGRNGWIGDHTSYYFHQLGRMVEQARYLGISMWVIDMKFDCPDDMWSATFGLDVERSRH